MSRLNHTSSGNEQHLGKVGVGLRHPHFREALEETPKIDFVEVHAENFFSQGGLSQAMLAEVRDRYEISLHSTSMGLGSAQGVNAVYLEKLASLIGQIEPVLVSDHACFAWSKLGEHNVHAGDLLPLEFSRRSLHVLADNVDRVQQQIGRRILVENLSSYVDFGNSDMRETEFLTALVERSQCGLLVDLNNLLVNANNFGRSDPLALAKNWLDAIPAAAVGEFHLAGYTPVAKDELIIDDHSREVSSSCWELYGYALDRFGAVTTLVEWDNDLPEWQTLLAEAEKARAMMGQIFLTQTEQVREA